MQSNSNQEILISDIAALNKFLLAGEHPDLQDKNGNTLLHLAAKAYKEEAVDTLLMFGANPDIKNKKGEKPANVATFYRPSLKNNAIAKLLETMSTFSSMLFENRRAMKQAEFMFKRNAGNIEKIVSFKHISSELLKAIVVCTAKKNQNRADLVVVLDTILKNHPIQGGKLNFLQDSNVVSKICDALKQGHFQEEEKNRIITRLQEINTKDRTINYNMLEKAKTGKKSKIPSLWKGTMGAAKQEVGRFKEAIKKAKSGKW